MMVPTDESFTAAAKSSALLAVTVRFSAVPFSTLSIFSAASRRSRLDTCAWSSAESAS